MLAIKHNVDKVPWADVCYGCDAPWWVSRNGLQEFKGIKLAHADKAVTRYPDIKRVHIKNPKSIDILVDEPLHVGSGMNSGFQALNLAVQFGAKRILLIGYDFTDRSGVHWYGRNTAPGMNNPSGHNFRNWCKAMNHVAPWLSEHGIDVINASNHSEIRCFRRGVS